MTSNLHRTVVLGLLIVAVLLAGCSTETSPTVLRGTPAPTATRQTERSAGDGAIPTGTPDTIVPAPATSVAAQADLRTSTIVASGVASGAFTPSVALTPTFEPAKPAATE